MYMCMWGCLDKYIKVIVQPQTKIPNSVPGGAEPKTCDIQQEIKSMVQSTKKRKVKKEDY